MSTRLPWANRLLKITTNGVYCTTGENDVALDSKLAKYFEGMQGKAYMLKDALGNYVVEHGHIDRLVNFLTDYV